MRSRASGESFCGSSEFSSHWRAAERKNFNWAPYRRHHAQRSKCNRRPIFSNKDNFRSIADDWRRVASLQVGERRVRPRESFESQFQDFISFLLTFQTN